MLIVVVPVWWLSYVYLSATPGGRVPTCPRCDLECLTCVLGSARNKKARSTAVLQGVNLFVCDIRICTILQHVVYTRRYFCVRSSLEVDFFRHRELWRGNDFFFFCPTGVSTCVSAPCRHAHGPLTTRQPLRHPFPAGCCYQGIP